MALLRKERNGVRALWSSSEWIVGWGYMERHRCRELKGMRSLTPAKQEVEGMMKVDRPGQLTAHRYWRILQGFNVPCQSCLFCLIFGLLVSRHFLTHTFFFFFASEQVIWEQSRPSLGTGRIYCFQVLALSKVMCCSSEQHL